MLKPIAARILRSVASQTHLQKALDIADALMYVDAATALTSRHCNDFDVLPDALKLVMCMYSEADCGKHIALHGKPNTSSEALDIADDVN